MFVQLYGGRWDGGFVQTVGDEHATVIKWPEGDKYSVYLPNPVTKRWVACKEVTEKELKSMYSLTKPPAKRRRK